MHRLLEGRRKKPENPNNNSIGPGSVFMYKTIAPQCGNLGYVPCETKQNVTLERVYQHKTEAKKDLMEKHLGQDEELRGNASRIEKNSLTQIRTT